MESFEQVASALADNQKVGLRRFGIFTCLRSSTGLRTAVFLADRALRDAVDAGRNPPEVAPWLAPIAAALTARVRAHRVSGFGTFGVELKRGFQMHHPSTGKRMTVADRYAITFHADQALRDRVNTPEMRAAAAEQFKSWIAYDHPLGPTGPRLYADLFRVEWDALEPLIDRWCARLAEETARALDRVGAGPSAAAVRSAAAGGEGPAQWKAFHTAVRGAAIAGGDPDRDAVVQLVALGRETLDRVVQGAEGAFGSDCWWCCDLGVAVAVAAGLHADWPTLALHGPTYRALCAEAEALAT